MLIPKDLEIWNNAIYSVNGWKKNNQKKKTQGAMKRSKLIFTGD
jgi:hypothetical protein